MKGKKKNIFETNKYNWIYLSVNKHLLIITQGLVLHKG